MRTTILAILLLGSAAGPLLAQDAVDPPEIAAISTSRTKPIPKFLVYRHFLAWVNDSNSKAVAAGESDPYKFAEPFQRAGLEAHDLDPVLKEAKALDSDLAKHDKKLRAVIAEYRRTAQNHANQSLALPPAPAQIHELQAMRTAILVQHMVSLQSALGPQKITLEAFLDREFVPHISLKPLARPPASTAPGIPVQPFTLSASNP